MIDLHTHSSASDGDLGPGELVKTAAEKGIRALAITDHDTVSGLAEAEEAARKQGVYLIPGVELEISAGASGLAGGERPAFGQGGASAQNPVVNGEFHLLGLGIRRPSDAFAEALRRQEGARERRNRRVIEIMREAGIAVNYEDIAGFAGAAGGEGGRIIGRPHFGAFLISRKIVKNQEQAFKRYLGKGRPFYVPKEGLAFREAAVLIHESGGIAVLAHPLSLYVAWGRLPDLFGRLQEEGLDGIEAWHPTAKPRACKRLEELGRSFHLYITAGSDFHGSARPDRKLGVTSGGRKIDDSFLDAIEPLVRLST
jgi:predicted metal-dependent phosphoesterase TrpH